MKKYFNKISDQLKLLPFLLGIIIFAIILFIGNLNKEKSKVPASCTIFSASLGNTVLFGNNEDFYKKDTYLWTDPADDNKFGCIYLGFEDFSHQGGINEKGLCFDANALPDSKINLHPELESPPFYEAPYQDYLIWLPVLILRKAANVEEAIQIAEKYQRSNWYPDEGMISYQLNFADAFGNAVVMSVATNGELAFSRKEKDENYLISTNYNKANPENAMEYPCKRYQTTYAMLSKIRLEDELTVDYFKSILDSVHQEGIFNTTLYSNIFDLKKGIIYLYYWHQFDEVVKINVKDELAKGKVYINIKDLFTNKTVKDAKKEYFRIIVILCAIIIVGTIGLIILIRKLRERKNQTCY